MGANTLKQRCFMAGALLASALAVGACKDSRLPLSPDGEPRFTELVIAVADATPARSTTVSPGRLDYDLNAHYQIGPEYAQHTASLVFWGLVAVAFDSDQGSWDDASVFRYAEAALTQRSGTASLRGSAQVPECPAGNAVVFVVSLRMVQGADTTFVNAAHWAPFVTTASCP